MKRKYIKPQTISVETQAESWLMAASGNETTRNTNGQPNGVSGTIKSSTSSDLDWSKGQGNGGNRAKGHYSSWDLWDE